MRKLLTKPVLFTFLFFSIFFEIYDYVSSYGFRGTEIKKTKKIKKYFIPFKETCAQETISPKEIIMVNRKSDKSIHSGKFYVRDEKIQPCLKLRHQGYARFFAANAVYHEDKGNLFKFNYGDSSNKNFKSAGEIKICEGKIVKSRKVCTLQYDLIHEKNNISFENISALQEDFMKTKKQKEYLEKTKLNSFGDWVDEKNSVIGIYAKQGRSKNQEKFVEDSNDTFSNDYFSVLENVLNSIESVIVLKQKCMLTTTFNDACINCYEQTVGLDYQKKFMNKKIVPTSETYEIYKNTSSLKFSLEETLEKNFNTEYLKNIDDDVFPKFLLYIKKPSMTETEDTQFVKETSEGVNSNFASGYQVIFFSGSEEIILTGSGSTLEEKYFEITPKFAEGLLTNLIYPNKDNSGVADQSFFKNIGYSSYEEYDVGKDIDEHSWSAGNSIENFYFDFWISEYPSILSMSSHITSGNEHVVSLSINTSSVKSVSEDTGNKTCISTSISPRSII